MDATLKPGASHLYSRRTFYVDEDSWQVLAVDQYDGRGQLWLVSEAHCINYYDAQTFWSTLEVHTDLLAGLIEESLAELVAATRERRGSRRGSATGARRTPPVENS